MSEVYKNDVSECRLELAKTILQIVKDEASQKGIEKIEINEMDVSSFLEKPPETKLGDFAIPCFRFSKILRSKPEEIARLIAQGISINKNKFVEKVETVGAFLNIFINKRLLATTAVPEIFDGKFFTAFKNHPTRSKEKVMIEFSQPNTHKEFHVGHMRNVALGDSLSRIFRYGGYDVIAVNYPGDEGTHIAKCLWFLKKENLNPPAGADLGAWLGEIYVKATMTLASANPDEKKKFDEDISQILKNIESKSGPDFELWKKTREWSLQSFYKIYDWLGVKFDHYFFESELSEESQKIVDEYLKKDIFKKSEGAIGIDLNEFKLGFLLLRKRDGNTLYATKDLTLARRKFDEFGVDRSIYIVGQEQNLHFKQVFKTLELMGFAQAKKCFHLSYGLVVLPEGKMSSREGNTIPFEALRSKMEVELHEILKKYESEWSAEEIDETRKRLCVGAIKYGMLSADPVKEVVFNLKEWLSFEGDSGPYLMYCYARTQSILRKASLGAELKDAHTPLSPAADSSDVALAKSESGVRGSQPVINDPNQLTSLLSRLSEPEEEELIRYIYDFNEVVLQAMQSYKPSVITHYLFDMCKAFNRFYIKLPVLRAETKELKEARLLLVEAFAGVVRKGLELLGIEPPEKM